VIGETARPTRPSTKPRPVSWPGLGIVTTMARGWESVAPQVIRVTSQAESRDILQPGHQVTLRKSW